MLFEKYTFACHFNTPALLPQFKGSTLRGGFGHALKKISCALRCQTCDSCLLFETCAYAFLFEVKKVLPFEVERLRTAQRPHPYVISPPCDSKRIYQAGDSFSFEMLLFGRANDYLPHIVYAVREMGKSGLGKGTQAGGRFSITTVRQGEKTIFTGDQLEAGLPLQRLELSFPPAPMIEKVGISCLTPLRLKYSNELRDSLPFHLLIRAALRRISTLEEVYGEGEPDLDYKGIAARATEVQVGSSSCKWHEIKRYSNRQQRAMMLGGIEGQIVYEGQSLTEFLPLLHYCEQTHIGKQTSFGLGKIAVHDEDKA